MLDKRSVPKEKTERNKQLAKDFMEGTMSNPELVAKYKITMTRVYQIIDKLGIDRNQRKNRHKN